MEQREAEISLWLGVAIKFPLSSARSSQSFSHGLFSGELVTTNRCCRRPSCITPAPAKSTGVASFWNWGVRPFARACQTGTLQTGRPRGHFCPVNWMALGNVPLLQVAVKGRYEPRARPKAGSLSQQGSASQSEAMLERCCLSGRPLPSWTGKAHPASFDVMH